MCQHSIIIFLLNSQTIERCKREKAHRTPRRHDHIHAPSCWRQCLHDPSSREKLSGAAQTSFIKKCVRDSCNATSVEKKLAGAAKDRFTKKCLADGLTPYCEGRAAGKKLSGAAKTSFMNKCQTGK